MRCVDAGGNTHEGPVMRFVTGWNLKSFELDDKDVRAIARMPDQQALAVLRQLSARVDRV